MHAIARAIEAPQKPRHGAVTMHPADIQAALKKAGKSQADIARELRVTPATVSEVIHGLTTSRRIANHISKITGLSLSKLWPGRYEPKN